MFSWFGQLLFIKIRSLSLMKNICKVAIFYFVFTQTIFHIFWSNAKNIFSGQANNDNKSGKQFANYDLFFASNEHFIFIWIVIEMKYSIFHDGAMFFSSFVRCYIQFYNCVLEKWNTLLNIRLMFSRKMAINITFLTKAVVLIDFPTRFPFRNDALWASWSLFIHF